MKFSILTSVLGTDPRETIPQARELGFAGVLLAARTNALDLTELSSTGRRDFRQLVSSNKQMLVAIRAEVGTKGFGPGADIDRMLAHLDRVMQLSVDLRGGCVAIDLGPLPAPVEPARAKPAITAEQAGLIIVPVPAPAPEPKTSTPPDPAFIWQVDSALEAVGELADRYRTTVAFSSSLAGFAAIERVLNAVRCPWFGIDLDPVALLRDSWSPDELFVRLGTLVRHVRARDAVVGEAGRTKPVALGKGSVKWDELLNDLRASDYHGWITLDATEAIDPPRAAAAGLDYLSKLTKAS